MFPNDGLSINGGFDQKLFWTPNIWTPWHKPEGCSIVFMFCMGAGAGGAAGTSSSTTGGGGGGSGAVSKLTIPAFMLPDILYVFVGQGGASGIGGSISYISNTAYSPSTTPSANTCYLASGHTAATAASAGTGGAAEVIATVAADCVLASGGITHFVAGHSGGNSSTTENSLPNVLTAGGAGGAGGGGAGPNVIGVGLLPNIVGGAFGSGGGSPGGMGVTLMGVTGFMSNAGAGGGSSGSGGIGGKGGNGAVGCGGGGGGTGASATGGVGGTGGNGFIGIWCK